MKFPNEFDVQIYLGYGEMIVFHNAILRDEHSDNETKRYDFRASTKTVEYLPYWQWFWENIFDSELHTSDINGNKKDRVIKIGDLEIPIRSFSIKDQIKEMDKLEVPSRRHNHDENPGTSIRNEC